jgi:hypothetical protein
LLKARLIGAGKKEKTCTGFTMPARLFLCSILVAVCSLLWSCLAISDSRAPGNGQKAGIHQATFYVEEGGEPLDLTAASKLFQSGAFSDVKLPLSLGIGAKPVWVRFDFSHTGNTALPKRLSVHTSWLANLTFTLCMMGRWRGLIMLVIALPILKGPGRAAILSLTTIFPQG